MKQVQRSHVTCPRPFQLVSDGFDPRTQEPLSFPWRRRLAWVWQIQRGRSGGDSWGAPSPTPFLSLALPAPVGHPPRTLPVWGRPWDAVLEDKALDQGPGVLAWSPGFALELLYAPKRSSQLP